MQALLNKLPTRNKDCQQESRCIDFLPQDILVNHDYV
jgi:hypothetical protein